MDHANDRQHQSASKSLNQASLFYSERLKKMSPEEKIRACFSLSELGREAVWAGVQMQFPGASTEEQKRIFLRRWNRKQT